jgi:hypothetical protein
MEWMMIRGTVEITHRFTLYNLAFIELVIIFTQNKL